MIAVAVKSAVNRFCVFLCAGYNLVALGCAVVCRNIVGYILIKPFCQRPARVSLRQIFVYRKHLKAVLFVKRSRHKVESTQAQVIAALLPRSLLSRVNEHRAESLRAVIFVRPELGEYGASPLVNVQHAARYHFAVFVFNFENKLLLLGMRLLGSH